MSAEFTYWTNIFKKIIYISFIILAIFVVFKLAVFYMPFLIAFIISLIMEPLIKALMKKMKLSRKISSIIIFIITFGIILGLLIWGITTLVMESTNLLENLNIYYNKASEQVQKITNNFRTDNIKIPGQIQDVLKNTFVNVLGKVSNGAQRFLTNFIAGLSQIPTIAIYFGVTILSLYFLCTDRIYMLDELEHHLPEKWMKNLSKHLRELVKVIGGYLKAQAILILISFCISLVGLYIMHFLNWNVKFPLLIALGIAFIDALPIIGSGTAMIPWGVLSAIDGNINLGIGIIVLWIIMSVTRQIIEPKIVSRENWYSSNFYSYIYVYRI